MNPYDIVPVLKRILSAAANAEEVIFAPNHAPKVRIGNDLGGTPLKDLKRFSAYQTEILAFSLMAYRPEARARFLQHGATSFSFSIPKLNHFRVHLLRQMNGIALSMKVIPFHPPTFDFLGLPRMLARQLEKTRGLLVVASPDRGGKSTTLAALINHLNQQIPRQIVCVESPAEYRISTAKGLVHYLEVGSEPGAMLQGFRKARKQGAQVIMVADLENPELISEAVDAAETGTLILGGMNSCSSAGTLAKLRRHLPKTAERVRFAKQLRALVFQELLARKDGKGNVAAYEMLLGNEAVTRLMEKNTSGNELQSVLKQFAGEGMQSFTQDLNRLLKTGLISEEEAGRFQPVRTRISAAPRSEPGSRNTELELDDSLALEFME